MIKTALHSVSYSGTWGAQCFLPLDRIITKAAEFGYDGIEIAAKRPHASPLDLDIESRKKLKDSIKSKGLEIACIAAYNDFADPSPFIREMNLLQLRETIHLAYDLEAKLVRVFASGMGNMHTGADFDEQWAWVCENLTKAAKYAEDQDILLGLQNHSPIMHSYKNVLQMIKEVGSDSLKAVIDAPLLFFAGESVTEAVKEAGNLIVHSHTGPSDMVWGPGPLDHTVGGLRRVYTLRKFPLGKGNTNYRAFVNSLKEIGYDGFLSYEICGSVPGGGDEENLDKWARDASVYMKSLLE